MPLGFILPPPTGSRLPPRSPIPPSRWLAVSAIHSRGLRRQTSLHSLLASASGLLPHSWLRACCGRASRRKPKPDSIVSAFATTCYCRSGHAGTATSARLGRLSTKTPPRSDEAKQGLEAASYEIGRRGIDRG